MAKHAHQNFLKYTTKQDSINEPVNLFVDQWSTTGGWYNCKMHACMRSHLVLVICSQIETSCAQHQKPSMQCNAVAQSRVCWGLCTCGMSAVVSAHNSRQLLSNQTKQGQIIGTWKTKQFIRCSTHINMSCWIFNQTWCQDKTFVKTLIIMQMVDIFHCCLYLTTGRLKRIETKRAQFNFHKIKKTFLQSAFWLIECDVSIWRMKSKFESVRSNQRTAHGVSLTWNVVLDVKSDSFRSFPSIEK